MTNPTSRLEAQINDMARTLVRIETRLCRLALHMGAQDAAGIPPTKPPTPNPKQLELTSINTNL